MPTRRSAAPLAAVALFLSVTACQRDVTNPLTTPPDQPPATSFKGALVEVTISGIGGDRMSAKVSTPTLAAPLAPSLRGGVSLQLSAPKSGTGGGDGTIQLEPLSTGSFTQGARGSGGVRYIWATFRVRNAQEDSTAYNTPRRNLTFFAASKAGALGQSAIASMQRFDGSPANPSIATAILPTGSVYQQNGQLLPGQADVLQVLTESEADSIARPAGVEVLPYGFVVRNAAGGGRTLPASPALGQFDGVVTFAFKVPLQATAAEDPFSISAFFLAQDDSQARLTQSIEEQTPEGEAAFLARVKAIDADLLTVLPGPRSYAGHPSNTRAVCSVRTAGTRASPAAHLVHLPVASVALEGALPSWPLWAGGSVSRDLGVTARDGELAPVATTNLPLQWTMGTADVLEVVSGARVRMLPRLDRASTTVSVSVCGVTSAPVALRSSGFSPIAGNYHSLAVKSDGTVMAWGNNFDGQTIVPGSLTNVVQLAAGNDHSLALKSDGTVVGWGYNGNGQTGVPAELTDVVQISAGDYYSLALKSDGTVVGWGGQATIPAGLTDVVQVAAGGFHSLALKSDGTVVGWGENSSGQATIPAGLTDVVQVAAGSFHSLALKSDGTVVGWGYNGRGEVTVPAGLTGVVHISTGIEHTLALKSDGTVVAWGDNSYGQATIPAGLTDVVQVAAVGHHSLALKSDGTVVAWGRDNLGQANVPVGLVAALP